MEAYGVPRSDDSFDEDEAEDFYMHQVQDRQRTVPTPTNFCRAEDDDGLPCDDDLYDYSEREVDQGVALGEAMLVDAAAGGASQSTDAWNGSNYPWQQHMRQHRNPTDNSKKARKVSKIPPLDDEDDLLEDAPRRVGAGASASSSGADENVSMGDVSDELGNAGAAATQTGSYVDASAMPGYNPEHYGYYITAVVPQFRHGTSSNSTWMSYSEAKDEVEGMVPVRAMCWNVPAELFSFDSTRFRHWSTPEANPARANNIASVLSFCFTGTSKGFL